MSDKISKIIEEFVEGKILDENLEDIVGERFGRYSKYIIQDRALPDVRDGLKPVQRRILFAMHKLGLTQDKPYKKSARIVGDVIGKYHPHGDSSVYEAIVRMSQDFKQREPLIDMHGNNGSIDGDSAAAMRYTEARMSKVSEYLLRDIDKRTVDFIPNFDDEEYEPIVLPARFPNILVNGASGISAGYATEIPPHNLEEIIKGVIKRIDKPNCNLDELMRFVKGPDFPTGAIVQGQEGIKQAFETGRGRIIIKSKVAIEGNQIIVTEIPYEVNKASLVRAIDDIRLKKKIDGIREVRDETSNEGLRIVIEIKNAFDPEAIVNFLHKKTDLTKSFNYNMVAIDQKRPRTMGLFDIFDAYIYHQKAVTTNRTNYDLRKAEKRLHIVDGIITMVDILDEVIALIRKSKSKKDAKTRLIKDYHFTEEQAEAILTLQLYRLSSTDLTALIKEKENLEQLIEQLKMILSNEDELESVIKKELREVMKQNKNKRRSLIEETIEKITVAEEDLIESEQVALGITKDGYLRQASLRSYKATDQPDIKEHDCFLYEGEHDTLSTILIFTNKGNYIYLPIFKIPQTRWKDIGTHINHFVKVETDERLIDVQIIDGFNTEDLLLMTTKHNQVKMTPIKDFEVLRYHKTFKAITLNKQDRLVHITRVDHPKGEVLSLSKQGYGLKYHLEDVPVSSLSAKGVKAMNLAKNDTLAASIKLKDHHDVVLLTQRGTLKRIDPSVLEKKKRTLKGERLYKQVKTNPYHIVDAALLNHTQYKHRALVNIITNKARITTTGFELKHQQAETGKRFTGNKAGLAFKLTIQPMEEEPDLSPLNAYKTTSPNVKKQVSLFEEDL